MRLIDFLGSWLILQVSARILPQPLSSLPNGTLYPQTFRSVAPRAERSKCSPPTFGASHFKRDLENASAALHDVSLRTRMTLPEPGEMRTFIVGETGENVDLQIIWWDSKINPDTGEEARTDYNTAQFVRFSDYENTEFSIGTGGLSGCTVLVVVSRHAVYVAHYWENISFSPDQNFLGKKTPERQFEMTVIQGLNQGKGGGQQQSLKWSREKIDDENIKAYLMHPKQTYNGIVDGYRDHWDKIKQEVGKILPRFDPTKKAGADNWKEIPYDAKEEPDPDTGEGRCLFKYDPNHDPDAQGKGRKRAMFWAEEEETA